MIILIHIIAIIRIRIIIIMITLTMIMLILLMILLLMITIIIRDSHYARCGAGVRLQGPRACVGVLRLCLACKSKQIMVMIIVVINSI